MRKIVIGILAHVDSGKTTLSEALMYCSGNISKLGRVDHGSSFLDNFTMERERGITIFSKQAVFNYGNTEFTLLDTPGHVDFSAEAERTLQVLDYAVLVINGAEGVQSHTYTLWKLLQKYDIPCFIFVNKTDLAGADKNFVMAQVTSKLSEACVSFDIEDRDSLCENIALCDEDLLEQYDTNNNIELEDIINAVADRKIFPCCFGSALKLIGIEHFLKILEKYTKTKNFPNDFGGRVYKISTDEQGSRLTFLKVTGGRLKVKDILTSEKNCNDEKVNQIRIYSGEKFTQVDEVSAGTICAVTGITFANCGDGLGFEKNTVFPLLSPVLTYTVEPPESIDAHTLLPKMKLLEAEEPQLNVVWNDKLNEIQVRLMGDIQLEIFQRMIFERFNIAVTFGKGKIIYKETISEQVEGVGHFEPLRHYAEVHLLMKPTKPNSGVIINSNCREDILDKNWQRLILTHLYEKTHIGVLTGSPITDIEITLISGKSHAKHTEGGDFRQATYRAVRQGLRSTKSVLLEPYYDFTLEVPEENIGKAMNDIQLMHGSFEPFEHNGEFCILSGTAPVSTMSSYSSEVVRYTHGRGKLECRFKGYEPCHNSEEVIQQIGYNADSDTENPCDSVFCSHGVGHIVKWDKVPEYMHLPYYDEYNNSEDTVAMNDRERLYSMCRTQSDIFALDNELMQIFEQTYGAVKKRSVAESRSFGKSSSEATNYKRGKSQQYSGIEYLLVDGYNVIFSWEKLKQTAKENIDAARNMLINILCNYQGYKKCELILVFDAYKVKGNVREVEKIGNISVVYTKEAETADMYIEKTSHKLAKNNRVRVVTSDGLEQLIILGGGALRVSSQAFLTEVEQAEKEIMSIVSSSSGQ